MHRILVGDVFNFYQFLFWLSVFLQPIWQIVFAYIEKLKLQKPIWF